MKTNMRFLRWMVCLIVILATICPGLANGQTKPTRFGISGTAGVGLFVASEKALYFNKSTDMYPEIGLQLHLAMIRAGLKAGFIYRNYKVGYYYEDYHVGFDYTLAFIPVQAELLVAPVKLTDGITPYFGIMGGAFIPVGDNDDVIPAISPKIGLEGLWKPFLVYGDLRYTWAQKDGHNYGGVMLIVGIGLYLGT